jgi:hypothetical protein
MFRFANNLLYLFKSRITSIMLKQRKQSDLGIRGGTLHWVREDFVGQKLDYKAKQICIIML